MQHTTSTRHMPDAYQRALNRPAEPSHFQLQWSAVAHACVGSPPTAETTHDTRRQCAVTYIAEHGCPSTNQSTNQVDEIAKRCDRFTLGRRWAGAAGVLVPLTLLLTLVLVLLLLLLLLCVCA